MTSAQGVDVSSYQAPLDTALLHGMSFAFAKATEGLDISDRNFADNWAAIRAAGIHRGAYHELTPDDPGLQAGRFMAAVRAGGLEPGDMLACIASDYPVTGAQARAFCDRVRSLAGPKSPVLLYSDLSRLELLAECAGYPLWLAYYAPAAPATVRPWRTWTLWQFRAGGGADGGDADAFNGGTAALDAWIASYAGPPPGPADPPGAPHLSVTGHAYGANLGWSSVATAPQKPGGREYELEVTPGWTPATRTVVGQHLHVDLAPGRYQARVRAAGDPHAPWCEWRNFTVTA